jgi:hypothetical protein
MQISKHWPICRNEFVQVFCFQIKILCGFSKRMVQQVSYPDIPSTLPLV